RGQEACTRRGDQTEELAQDSPNEAQRYEDQRADRPARRALETGPRALGDRAQASVHRWGRVPADQRRVRSRGAGSRDDSASGRNISQARRPEWGVSASAPGDGCLVCTVVLATYRN